MVILINHGSASRKRDLRGVPADYHRAVIPGFRVLRQRKRTIRHSLADGQRAALTTAKYIRRPAATFHRDEKTGKGGSRRTSLSMSRARWNQTANPGRRDYNAKPKAKTETKPEGKEKDKDKDKDKIKVR